MSRIKTRIERLENSMPGGGILAVHDRDPTEEEVRHAMKNKLSIIRFDTPKTWMKQKGNEHTENEN